MGSIKWLENRPFGAQDLTRLVHHRACLPGATEYTPLLAVSRNGSTVDEVTTFEPEDLLPAWRR